MEGWGTSHTENNKDPMTGFNSNAHFLQKDSEGALVWNIMLKNVPQQCQLTQMEPP